MRDSALRGARAALMCLVAACTAFAQDGAPQPPDPAGAEAAEGAEAGPDGAEAGPDGAEAGPEAPGDVPDDEAALDDLDSVLDTEVTSGDTGSFGYRLARYGVQPFLHAYVTFDYVNFEDARTNTFDLHYFNLFVGANIQDTVFPEIQVEYEHGGDEIAVRFAQVDIRLHELFTIRAGLWLVPFGTYNEFLYPEFLSLVPREYLLSMRQIVPVVWSEVGVQVRGRWELADELEVNYAVYVVNGLEQTDVAGGRVDDGGSIRSMRPSATRRFRDANDGHKSVGGRIGFKGWGLSLGLSHFWGAYTVDGNQNLYLWGCDLYLERWGFSLGLEGVMVVQHRWRRTELHKRGGFVWLGYRFEEVPIPGDLFSLDVQPVVAFDYQHLDSDSDKRETKKGWFGGVNLYPFPKVLPNFKWAIFYGGYDQHGDEARDNVFTTQVSFGF